MNFTTILLCLFVCCRVFDRLMTGLISPTWLSGWGVMDGHTVLAYRKTTRNLMRLTWPWVWRPTTSTITPCLHGVVLTGKLQRYLSYILLLGSFNHGAFIKLKTIHKCLSTPIKGRAQSYSSLHSNVYEYMRSHDAG